MRRKLAKVVPFLSALCLSPASAGCTGLIDPLPSHSNTRSNPASRSPAGNPGDPSGPGDPSNPVNSSPSDPTNPTQVDAPLDTSKCQAPPSRVVRLSKLELQNSVADLFGAGSVIDLPDDAKFLNFSSNAEALVTPPFANALKAAAETLSSGFRKTFDPSRFGSSCTTSDENARTCATAFVNEYGKKAFRRPLAQQDVDGLLAVYDAGRQTGVDGNVEDCFRSGIDYTLRAILESPEFLYRVEIGDLGSAVGGATNLSPYETASSLSYMLVASPPDDALLAAAAAGKLGTPDALEAQARRLISAMPDRFAAQQRRFVREWLAIDFTAPAWDKNTTVYPLYSAALKSALDQETDLYIDDWVSQGPTLTSLFTRSETFVNDVNAPVYGLTGHPGAMTKVTLDPEQRPGILSMPGFLGTRAHTDSSAPILRGISIVRGVMCVTIPPPPPNVPQLPPITDMSFTTTRDRVEKHVANGACPGCHSQINPLGYPFESYDGLGVYRTKENGYDVDPSGGIVGTLSSDQPVANAAELTRALVKSPEVQDCFGRQVFRYVFGRETTAADECTVRAAAAAYQAKELDARELVIALVGSETFSRRTITP